MRNAVTLCLMAVLLSGIAACGKRGPLSLPQASLDAATYDMDG